MPEIVVPEIVVPPLVPPTSEGNLSDLPHRWAHTDPGRPLLAVAEGDTWHEISAAEFAQQVRALAKGLMAAGVMTGDRVALLSRNRYEWTLADFAIWSVGAVVVPIYDTSSADQVRWIMQDSASVAIIVETSAHRATLAQVRADLNDLRDVWQIDSGGLDEVVGAGVDIADGALDERRAGLRREDLATIIYTSGTTGRPKGCELTHGNFYALAENTTERLETVVASPGARTLLFLPLAHVFARFVEVLALHSGATLAHTADLKNLLDDLGTFHPTFLLAVPGVFERIYNTAEQRAESSRRGRLFRRAAQVAREWSIAQDGDGPTLLLKAQHAVFDRLVYARLRGLLGGRVEYAVSGGAALGERLGHFYRGLGLVVLEGYGLTETTAPATVNTPEMIKIGTVGRPLPGVAVRITPEGEVLVSGNNVLRGYHNDPEATAQAMREGWLHTGDLGELDDDGFLRITGRSKEILVTSSGKNLAPAPLEDLIRAHPLVSQCVVVGDAKPFVAALVTLDADMLPTWSANHDLGQLDVDRARAHPKVREAIQAAIDAANASVSRAESIRRFAVLDTDFTQASGHLTPTLKVKRAAVIHDHAAEVEALYS